MYTTDQIRAAGIAGEIGSIDVERLLKVLEREAKKQVALKRVEEAYYDINSPHYKDNERYSWAVKAINSFNQ